MKNGRTQCLLDIESCLVLSVFCAILVVHEEFAKMQLEKHKMNVKHK